MSQKQFSILIGAGILCALLFAAPGLYRFAKEYKMDKARAEASKPKGDKWYDITRDPKYWELSPQARQLVKKGYFERSIIPKLDEDPSLKGRQEVYDASLREFMQIPDDNGQGVFTSMLGSAGRGAVAIFPWCFDELASWQISPGFTEFATSVRTGIEAIAPVNPIHADKAPSKVAFWLGFIAPFAAFFVIRTRYRKKLTTKPPAPVLRAA